jgi:hypothetical protein
MNEINYKSGRYLLFLDILGFRKFAKNSSSQEIYAIIDTALKSFSRWEEINRQFRTIYFSDTFIFYQVPKGFGEWAFLDVYAIGAMLLSALLAKGIPARGSITFGEFEVKSDSSNKHQLFFGKALIEAYETEKKEQWIGISIQPSGWEIYEKSKTGIIKTLESEKVWKIRHDGVLLLNPFIKLRGWYEYDLIDEIDCPYMEWDVPEFPNDIMGFKFLIDKAAAYANMGDFLTHEAVKYHSTVAFLKEVMGKKIYDWALQISDRST